MRPQNRTPTPSPHPWY